MVGPHQGGQAARARRHRRARARRSCRDVPTLIESGRAGLFEAYVWMGLLAPKGTPAPIIDRLHRELVAALATQRGQDATLASAAHRDRRLHARRIRRVTSARRKTAGRRSSSDTGAQRRLTRTRTTRSRGNVNELQTRRHRTAPVTGVEHWTHKGDGCACSCGRNSSARPRASPRCCSCTARRWRRSRRSTSPCRDGPIHR